MSGLASPLTGVHSDKSFDPDDAGVVKWQTRQTQNLLYASMWGFKSLHRHSPLFPLRGYRFRKERLAGLGDLPRAETHPRKDRSLMY